MAIPGYLVFASFVSVLGRAGSWLSRQSERLMLQIYTISSQSSDQHAAFFSEASDLNLEFNALQHWMQQQLRETKQELMIDRYNMYI